MKSVKKVLAIALVIGFFVSALNLFVFHCCNFTWENILENFSISFIFSLCLSAANSYYYDGLNLRYDWEKEPRKMLWYGALGSFFITMLVFGILRYLMVGYFSGNFSLTTFWANETMDSYIVALVITVIAILGIHAFYFYRALQKRQVKEQKIIAGSASARFDALKNQLDPHFLFNSLNVLTSLIEEDPYQAQKFTTSLSKVYRYVLEQKNKDLVTVDEELDFARTYVRLLKMRFEDSIVLEIPESASDPEAKIVPLSLQLLLENAVKHNVVNASRPLSIKVLERDGMLVVQNNLQEKSVIKKSSGVGLQNIKQRYSMFTSKEVGVGKTDTSFTVRLPILQEEVPVVVTQERYIEEKRLIKAKEYVEGIKGFYGNLLAYCIVIPFLWWFNLSTTSFLWAFFPTIGWGFGLLGHGLEAFGFNPLWGKRWEQRKIKELMDKEDF